MSEQYGKFKQQLGRVNRKGAQVEIKWSDPEPFALVPIKTLDGDKLAAQAAQLEADKQQADQRQTEINA